MGRTFFGRLFRILTLCLAVVISQPALGQSSDVAQDSEPFVFEVEQVQNDFSLATSPDIDTPRGLLEAFLEAGERKEWTQASTMLDMSNIDEGPNAPSSEELAARLYDIIHRSVSVDWASLPDRPDAVDNELSNKNPMAGVARRSLAIGTLELPNRPVSIRIARVRAPGSEPVWVFSRQTVANVPALYAEYGPTNFERSLPGWLRQQAFWTLAWWEVIALPLVLLMSAFAAALTYLAIKRWRDRLDEDAKLYDGLRAVQLPITLLAFAGTFALVRATVLRLSGPVEALLDPAQLVLVIVAVLGIVLSVIEAMFEFATDRRTDRLEAPENSEDRRFYTKMSAIRRIVTALVILAAIGFLLVASDLSSTLGFSIIASAGVFGLVLAFAARKVLGDIMASVEIAFAQTARIGDAVYYDDRWCYVEKIGFTHLRLRTWDERRLVAPVSAFTSESFENWTKKDPSLMMHVELELDNRADVEALRGPFRDFLKNDEDVIDPEDAKCQVVGQNARAMIVRFMARSTDPRSGWAMHCRLRERMLAVAAELDAGAGNEPSPAYLPREREVHMDAEG